MPDRQLDADADGPTAGQSKTDAIATATAAAVVSAATLVVAFGLLAAGVDWFWVAFPVGYGGVLPVVMMAAKARADAGASEEHVRPARAGEDELASVRERYARGELSEAAMERRIAAALDDDAAPNRSAREREKAAERDGRSDRDGVAGKLS